MLTISAVPQTTSAGTGEKPGFNRTLLVVLIVVIVVAAIGAVLAASLFLGPALSVTKQNFAPYSTPVSQSSSSPSSLTVADTNGRVTVSPWSQAYLMINGTTTARGFGASPSVITFVKSNSSGDIVFQAVFPATSFLSGSYTVDISVYVPASAQLNTVQIVTVNGNVQVSSISASSITLTDTNGSVSASGVTASTLTITDTNGSLDITCTSCI